MHRVATGAVLAALILGAGCAVTSKVRYTPAELRQELASRPGIRGADIIVPYELPPEAVEKARRLVTYARGDGEKVEVLVKAMFDPAGFGLSHELATDTTTAAEALREGRGNCVALASIFIGLARAVDLDARYMDASSRVSETHTGEDGTTVHLGHVSAMVAASGERIGLDFARLGPIQWYKPLDDLEAVAHFHNNRGYELVERAQLDGQAPDWAEAARLFRLSVVVKPEFARGWNNLGIAEGHLGRAAEAASHYRRASALDPALASPHANLGSALLQAGDLPAAVRELTIAATLDPTGVQLQYQLALARLRSGDRNGALQALRRTLALRADHAAARALLERLDPAPTGGRGPGGG